ncbi:FUSC family protein [Gordonia sputi]|uniref:FUSC family protein n=1 Tax=Gordonia sputi TaxID=36823 RepID=UPI00226FF608|nr:FUSC family protein [Gordonia sputi]
MQNSRSSIIKSFRVYDPGHTWLIYATSTTIATALGILVAHFVIVATHGPDILLVTGGIIGMVAFGATGDVTAKARWLTSVTVIVPGLAAAALGVVLTHHSPAEIVVSIPMAGFCIWVRRFGWRGLAVGGVTFFAYLMAILAMREPGANLQQILLVVGGALICGVLLRTVMLIAFPARRLKLHLRQFRASCAEALERSQRPGTDAEILVPVNHLPDLTLAMAGWLQQFDVASLGVDPNTLRRSMFDAQSATELACEQLQSLAKSGVDPHSDPALAGVLDALMTVVRGKPSSNDAAAAEPTARSAITTVDPSTPLGLATLFVSRALLAQLDLDDAARGDADRDDLSPPEPDVSDADVSDADVSDAEVSNTDASTTEGAFTDDHVTNSTAAVMRWWDHLRPTSRMAIQVMAATAIAAGVGQAIAAGRWYWAVMTTFIVFMTAATRADVLTKSSWRVVGTLVGVAFGAVVAILLVGHPLPLSILFLVCVFFGYYYQGANNGMPTIFFTIQFAVIYALLGFHNWTLAFVRLDETIAGAIVGVVCAYIVTSQRSDGAVAASVDKYFAALDHLIVSCGEAQTSAHQSKPVVDAAIALDNAHHAVRSTLSNMAAAMLVGLGARRRARSLQLGRLTRSAHVLAQTSSALSADPSLVYTGHDAEVVRAAVTRLRTDAEDLHQIFLEQPVTHAERGESLARLLSGVDARPDTARGAGVAASVRLDHLLRTLPATVAAPVASTAPSRQ